MDFTDLGNFLLSESSDAELCLSSQGEGEGQGEEPVSMTWRVTLTHLQWFNEDIDELETVLCK